MTPSLQGRRVLVAVVTEEIGSRIQAWRERHDPRQARRIPPHVTLHYWVPDVSMEILGAQVRHAFPAAIPVHVGRVHEFDNADRTLFLDVSDTAGLDAAHDRLHDGTHVPLTRREGRWTWHITCVRYGIKGDLPALREAATGLAIDASWPVNRIACLELRDDRYHECATWDLAAAK